LNNQVFFSCAAAVISLTAKNYTNQVENTVKKEVPVPEASIIIIV